MYVIPPSYKITQNLALYVFINIREDDLLVLKNSALVLIASTLHTCRTHLFTVISIIISMNQFCYLLLQEK